MDQQAETLLNGVSDIGVMNEPIPRGYLFELLTIRYRSLSAVMSNQQQWLKKPLQPLTIEDLAGVPLCVTRSLAPRLESFFRERGLHQDIRVVCSTNLFAMHWARRNMGIAVIMGEPEEDAGIGLTTMPIATEEIMGAEHIYTQNETFPFMMIRIADVAKFWSQIPAAVAGALNVAVTLPEGATETYRVTATDGRSRVEPTKDAADVTTDIHGDRKSVV